MDYNIVVDQTNIEIYRKHKIRRPHEYRHKCVLCGEVTCVNNSISSQGERLICNRCAIRRFETIGEAMRWVEGGNRD